MIFIEKVKTAVNRFAEYIAEDNGNNESDYIEQLKENIKQIKENIKRLEAENAVLAMELAKKINRRLQ